MHCNPNRIGNYRRNGIFVFFFFWNGIFDVLFALWSMLFGNLTLAGVEGKFQDIKMIEILFRVNMFLL